MQPLNSSEFRKLKSEIEAHPRACGYYLIDLVSIRDERDAGRSQEDILDIAFQYFDEVAWPPESERPSDQTWEHDYVVDYDTATPHVVEALVGGNRIGQLRAAITAERAQEFWQRFCNLFQQDRNYYIGMGLGDSWHVFLHGAAIVDFDHAGILWVVESD